MGFGFIQDEVLNSFKVYDTTVATTNQLQPSCNFVVHPVDGGAALMISLNLAVEQMCSGTHKKTGTKRSIME